MPQPRRPSLARFAGSYHMESRLVHLTRFHCSGPRRCRSSPRLLSTLTQPVLLLVPRKSGPSVTEDRPGPTRTTECTAGSLVSPEEAAWLHPSVPVHQFRTLWASFSSPVKCRKQFRGHWVLGDSVCHRWACHVPVAGSTCAPWRTCSRCALLVLRLGQGTAPGPLQPGDSPRLPGAEIFPEAQSWPGLAWGLCQEEV